jgi:hypothetical protein
LTKKNTDMQENLELQIAAQLYEQLYKTRPKTDGRLMELESYIVRHYGHEGTATLRMIAERNSVGPVVLSQQPKQGRPLKPFVHPDAKQPNETNAAFSVVQKPQAEAAAVSAPGGGSPLSALQSEKAAAADSGASVVAAPTGGETPDDVDPEDAKKLRASALAKKYGASALKKFLSQRGVENAEGLSATQLAALAIQTVNKPAK